MATEVLMLILGKSKSLIDHMSTSKVKSQSNKTELEQEGNTLIDLHGFF